MEFIAGAIMMLAAIWILSLCAAAGRADDATERTEKREHWS
jgi:hypothetical protein